MSKGKKGKKEEKNLIEKGKRKKERRKKLETEKKERRKRGDEKEWERERKQKRHREMIPEQDPIRLYAQTLIFHSSFLSQL
jgi:hypothetical protein